MSARPPLPRAGRRRAALRCGLAVVLCVAPASAAVFRTGQPVMGTVLQVTVVAADEPSARRLAAAAFVEARRWDDLLTTWRPEGELAQLNARAGPWIWGRPQPKPRSYRRRFIYTL